MMVYRLDMTLQKKKTLGFKYNRELNDYIYEFPVYRSHGKITLHAKVGVDEETNYIWVNVYDNDGKLYVPYYNRTYGKSNVIKIVDSNISKELVRLGAIEVEDVEYDT